MAATKLGTAGRRRRGWWAEGRSALGEPGRSPHSPGPLAWSKRAGAAPSRPGVSTAPRVGRGGGAERGGGGGPKSVEGRLSSF